VFSPVRHTITNTSSALFSGFHTCRKKKRKRLHLSASS
jgi:hypothetical protein